MTRGIFLFIFTQKLLAMYSENSDCFLKWKFYRPLIFILAGQGMHRKHRTELVDRPIRPFNRCRLIKFIWKEGVRIMKVVMIGLLVLVCTVYAGATEFVVNGTFESDNVGESPAGWMDWWGAGPDSFTVVDVAAEGIATGAPSSKVLKVVHNGYWPRVRGGAINDFTGFESTEMTFSFWIYQPAADAGGYPRMAVTTASYTNIASTVHYATPRDQWVFIDFKEKHGLGSYIYGGGTRASLGPNNGVIFSNASYKPGAFSFHSYVPAGLTTIYGDGFTFHEYGAASVEDWNLSY